MVTIEQTQAALSILVHHLGENDLLDDFVKTLTPEEGILYLAVAGDVVSRSEAEIQDIIETGIRQSMEAYREAFNV